MTRKQLRPTAGKTASTTVKLAGAKPRRPRPTTAGDTGPIGDATAMERYAVQENMAAAEEAQLNAFEDILAGRSPADAAALMKSLLAQQQARARAAP